MLLNTCKRREAYIPFPQELNHLKYHKPTASVSKNTEYFQTLTSVLDLLLHSHPNITSQLLILKQAVKKWHEHLQNESIGRSRQLMEMRDNLQVHVTKEIGATLEEIGYYVKYFTDNYRDEDMRRLYIQYLNAIKKLQWNHDYKPTSHKHQSVQTNQDSFSDPPTVKNIFAHRASEETLDSPNNRTYKDVDIHKYIRAKEESLELQRKASQLTAKNNDLDTENRALKREIERLHDDYNECRMSRDKELQEISKLKQLLSNLKEQEQARHQREMDKLNSFIAVDKRYDQCDSIKNAIQQNLEMAQMSIIQQQQMRECEAQEQFFNKNYRTILTEADDKYQTVKKEGNMNEYAEVGSQLRMLLIQALTIESYINGSFEQS